VNRDLAKVATVQPGMGIAPAVILIDPKYGHNAASALRSCAAFGVGQLWITGDRVLDQWRGRGRLHREERMKSYGSTDVFLSDYPFDAFAGVVPVAIEVRENAESLTDFEHPDNAVYVFGPEDGSLHSVHARQCHRFVIIPSLHCLNLATAVTVVLADRVMKRQRAGLQPRRPSYATLAEHRGFIDGDDSLADISPG
jgi:tRNA(Leu) C34 or U34 (ribose-2'-O)-methylase TrmL